MCVKLEVRWHYPYLCQKDVLRIYLINSSATSWMWLKINFNRSQEGFNSFLLRLDWLPTKAIEPILPYNLPKTGRRIDRFMTFSDELTQSETQRDFSRIRTRVVNLISNDNKRYTESTALVTARFSPLWWLGQVLNTRWASVYIVLCGVRWKRWSSLWVLLGRLFAWLYWINFAIFLFILLYLFYNV